MDNQRTVAASLIHGLVQRATLSKQHEVIRTCCHSRFEPWHAGLPGVHVGRAPVSVPAVAPQCSGTFSTEGEAAGELKVTVPPSWLTPA